VNQPLASIVNYAHGLIARLDGSGVDPATTRAVVQEIADGAMRASEVIRRLREFMRRGEAKLVHCDVNDIVRDTIRLTDPDLRQHAVHLDLELAARPLPVEVDRIQIAQVLLNLIRNAIEAMFGLPLPQRQLHIATEPCGPSQIEVRVRDTGIGLPTGAGGAIFEPFYTTKTAGLGLGLSISRSIVQAHGGALWATSNGGGTTVGFSLPVG
jgi:C4-dicarboxylate-specific signal transduction histidine kinase